LKFLQKMNGKLMIKLKISNKVNKNRLDKEEKKKDKNNYLESKIKLILIMLLLNWYLMKNLMLACWNQKIFLYFIIKIQFMYGLENFQVLMKKEMLFICVITFWWIMIILLFLLLLSKKIWKPKNSYKLLNDQINFI